jgi:integrase
VVEDPTSLVREKPPKSHNGTRSLLLDPVTLTTLTDIRPKTRNALISGYMFTGRSGQPLRPDNVSSRFNQLAAAAGVRPIGPHQMRHLLASTLLDTGYCIPEVAERLGHDPATLMRYYTRVNAVRRQQAADHIADLIAADGECCVDGASRATLDRPR